MSVKRKDLAMPSDLAQYRPEAWLGDTHDGDGKPLEDAKGKPRIARCVWSPAALAPDDLVDELHIHYTDGVVVKVRAERLRV